MPEAPASTTPTEDRGATRRWIGLGVGGLGIVGVGIGSALGFVAMSKRDQSNGGFAKGLCDESSNHCQAQGQSLRKDAESAATGSTIGFVAGGVALAAGVVLYVTSPGRGAQSGVTVTAGPMAGGAGATVRTTF